MRNYIDLIDNSRIQEAEIKEIAALFEALALRQVMLNESRLDEAGVWNAVKSAVGAGVAGVKTANDAINRLGQLAQNTAPVQGFDAKVEGILQKISAANPKIADAAKAYGEWAKKNPIKQGLIIGMLTAVASLVTGPAGGAAAAAVLRAGNGMLKGEKASTAIGGAVKSAALGWIAGLGFRELGSLIGHLKIEMFPLPGYKQIGQVKIYADSVGAGSARININAYLPPSAAKKLYQLVDIGKEYAVNGDYVKAQSIWNQAKAIVENPELQKQVQAALANNENLLNQAREGYKQITGFFDGLGAAAQGAIAGAASGNKKSTATQPQDQPAPNTPMAKDKRAELQQKRAALQQNLRQQGKLKESKKTFSYKLSIDE